jgi:hypothetical protein
LAVPSGRFIIPVFYAFLSFLVPRKPIRNTLPIQFFILATPGLHLCSWHPDVAAGSSASNLHPDAFPSGAVLRFPDLPGGFGLYLRLVQGL